MPLDGHEYLIRQGWEGKGSGLRHGGISRPIIVAQKKNMGGIGKDRDEAFPFWDHVFNAAASAIKVKCYDSDSEDAESSTPAVTFQKTKTGIISNRRPVIGTPALSGTATPSEDPSASSSGSSTPRLSIMAAAKQQAARRMLYSMFFRGPTLGTDIVEEKVESVVQMVIAEGCEEISVREEVVQRRKKEKKDKEKKERKRGGSVEDEGMDVEEGSSITKTQSVPGESETVRMKKRKAKGDKEKNEKESKKRKLSDEQHDNEEDKDARRARRREKSDRKEKKAEKKSRKEEKRWLKEAKKGKDVAMADDEEAEVKAADEDGGSAQPGADDSGAVPVEDEGHGRKRRNKGSASKSKKERKSQDRTKA